MVILSLAQTPVSHTPHTSSTTLRKCCLITNGNSHRPDLCGTQLTFHHDDLIMEAMLPEIRTIAMLIAHERHDFSQNSPAVFTEEADWFAARILVLNVRAFHLEVNLHPMLKIANQRAQNFAERHDLPFQAARIHAGLHTHRPANMLLMECELNDCTNSDLFSNTQAIRTQIHLSGSLKSIKKQQ